MAKLHRKIVPMLINILLLVVLCSFGAQAAGLNKTKASVNVKKTITLKVTGVSGSVKWSSSNKKIATVTAKGVVKGIKKGTATIVAKAGKNTYKCKVTVLQPVTKVKLNKTASTVYVGGISHLKATCTPTSASNKAVTWKSSNTKVAKVNAKGVITGVKAGTATITATAKDGSKKKATCKVTVQKFDYYPAEPELGLYDEAGALSGISFDGFYANLSQSGYGDAHIGFSLRALPVETGETASILKFKSSNTKVVKVSKTGSLTPVSGGTATITVTITDGYGKGAVSKTKVNVTDHRIASYIKKIDLTTSNFADYFGTKTVNTYNTWGEVTGKRIILTNKKDASGLYYYGRSQDFAAELMLNWSYDYKKYEIYTEMVDDGDGGTYEDERVRTVDAKGTSSGSMTFTGAHSMFYEGIYEEIKYPSDGDNVTNIQFKGFRATRVRGSIYLVDKKAVTSAETQTATNGEVWQILTLKNGMKLSLRVK